jgi:hypothetical protein
MSLTVPAVAFLLVVTLCYVALCAGSPFGTCRKCRGMGHATKVNRRGKVKRGKPCRRCGATGQRIRVGRHLFNLAQRLYRDGTTPAPTTPARPLTRQGDNR